MSETGVINVTIDRGRHTILVVDDNPVTRYSTARMIRAAGFLTQEAATGAEALALASPGISAVVLDVHLPDIEGFEVCRIIRANPATALLPVIHLSAAHVQDQDKVAGLNAGADGYLAHPVEPAVLVATLQALIRARMAEDGLRRSEARFRAIYDQAPSGIVLIDAQGCFTDVNPAMVALLGFAREALLGQPLSAFAPPEWAAFVATQTTRADSGAPWQGEFPLVRADGTVVPLEWNMSAHVEPGLRIGVAIDVSERRDLELRRQEMLEREQAARAAAERYSRTQDNFVAVLSHELRTPLNSLSGWVHILNRPDRTPALLQKGLDAIERGIRAQSRIISDILDVSRINAGKLRLHREWVEPIVQVQAALEDLQVSIAAKQLEVRLDAPGATQPAWLDAMRFQQIVWNLVTNAIKFSLQGGIIQIGLQRQGDVLSLTVQDFGQGIAPDFLAHLFDRFTQSGSPDNRHHGGLGLGLSIVKHLAELHGGSVQAHSAGPGQGTTLWVSLSVVPPELAERQEAGAPEPQVEVDRPLDGLNALVVEDNADASEMLNVVLTDGGASVRLADNYDAALQAVEQAWPDVLVCDIGLPGKDGYELIRDIRSRGRAERRPPLLAIALTAFSRPHDRERALQAGFDEHLAKPLKPHALLVVLQAQAQQLRQAASGSS